MRQYVYVQVHWKYRWNQKIKVGQFRKVKFLKMHPNGKGNVLNIHFEVSSHSEFLAVVMARLTSAGVYGFHKGFSVHRLTTVVHCPLNGWSFCYICAWHVSKSIFWTRKYYTICLRLSGKDLEMFRMLEHWVPRFVSTCSSRKKVLRALLEIETRNGLWALVTKYMGWPIANSTPNKITIKDTGGSSLFKTCFLKTICVQNPSCFGITSEGTSPIQSYQSPCWISNMKGRLFIGTGICPKTMEANHGKSLLVPQLLPRSGKIGITAPYRI